MHNQPKNPFNLELLLDYVDGILNRETRERIESHLQDNEDSRKIVEGIRAFYQQHGYDRSQLETFLAESEAKFLHVIQDFHESFTTVPEYTKSTHHKNRTEQQSPPHPKSSQWQPSLWISIAAGILILLVIGYFYVHPDGDHAESLVSSYLDTAYASPVTVRDKGNPPAPWVVDYQQGNYTAAGEKLENLATEQNAQSQTHFYTGLCKLYQSAPEPDKAIVYFNEVLSMNSPYTEQARWYLSLAYYLAGKKKEARAILERIVSQPAHYKKQEASVLLEHL